LLKISLKMTKPCSTGVNNLALDPSTRPGRQHMKTFQNPYFREHWRVPVLTSWYHQDIEESTKGFIHSMFGSDTKIGGKIGRCAVLSKHAFFNIDSWLSQSRECQYNQIPIPKCTWFPKLQTGHYDLALSQFNDEPQASISTIPKKV